MGRMYGMKHMMMLTLIAVLPMAVNAALSVSRGTSKDRSSGPACLSGITYAGGTTYYVIADNGTDCGLYKATINLGSDGKSVSSYSLGSKISLAMVSDIEGVAYDPASGNVKCIAVAGKGWRLALLGNFADASVPVQLDAGGAAVSSVRLIDNNRTDVAVPSLAAMPPLSIALVAFKECDK